MKIEHMLFIDSILYLPMPLRKLPEAFGLSVTKSWYPHYFNKNTNLNYVEPFTDISYFGVDEMRLSDRTEFIIWYNDQKNKVFPDKLVLEKYFQDNATLLRQPCQIFRRELMEIVNIEVFPESFSIASACNKVPIKRFLLSGTIRLITGGWYNYNNNYRNYAFIWLLYMENIDGCQIIHA